MCGRCLRHELPTAASGIGQVTPRSSSRASQPGAALDRDGTSDKVSYVRLTPPVFNLGIRRLDRTCDRLAVNPRGSSARLDIDVTALRSPDHAEPHAVRLGKEPFCCPEECSHVIADPSF